MISFQLNKSNTRILKTKFDHITYLEGCFFCAINHNPRDNYEINYCHLEVCDKHIEWIRNHGIVDEDLPNEYEE